MWGWWLLINRRMKHKWPPFPIDLDFAGNSFEQSALFFNTMPLHIIPPLIWIHSRMAKYSPIIIQYIILYSFFYSHILSPQHQRWKRRKGMSRLGRDWKRRKGMSSQPSHRAFLFFYGLFCIHYIGLLKALLSPTRTRKMISIFVITTIQTQVSLMSQFSSY